MVDSVAQVLQNFTNIFVQFFCKFLKQKVSVSLILSFFSFLGFKTLLSGPYTFMTPRIPNKLTHSHYKVFFILEILLYQYYSVFKSISFHVNKATPVLYILGFLFCFIFFTFVQFFPSITVNLFLYIEVILWQKQLDVAFFFPLIISAFNWSIYSIYIEIGQLDLVLPFYLFAVCPFSFSDSSFLPPFGLFMCVLEFSLSVLPPLHYFERLLQEV